jgi:hypothetical protein
MSQSQPIECNGSLPATLQGNGSLAAMADSARMNLPVAYETAKTAIAVCESTDECRTWADKHAALAAYALRIQLRAERRWGELDRELYTDRHTENLRQNRAANSDKPGIPAAKENPEFLQNYRKEADRLSGGGARPEPADGTSEYQRKTARRLAAIPEATFEQQVESQTPPTKTQLAEQGTAKRTVVRDPAAFAPAGQPFDKPQQHQALKAFAQFCESTDPVSLASMVTDEDRETVRQFGTLAERWLEQFVDNLPTDSW